jgi:hypothetical protein
VTHRLGSRRSLLVTPSVEWSQNPPWCPSFESVGPSFDGGGTRNSSRERGRRERDIQAPGVGRGHRVGEQTGQHPHQVRLGKTGSARLGPVVIEYVVTWRG